MKIRLILGRAAAIGLLVMGFAAAAQADLRTDRLVELLTTSSSYRVRVQSALSLGRLGRVESVPVLVSALGDEHSAVRTAAVVSLGRIGGPAASQALEEAVADASQPAEVVSQARQALEGLRRQASR